ncbi:YARHG domain-containing protein [Spirochaeta dissipatitropha]
MRQVIQNKQNSGNLLIVLIPAVVTTMIVLTSVILELPVLSLTAAFVGFIFIFIFRFQIRTTVLPFIHYWQHLAPTAQERLGSSFSDARRKKRQLNIGTIIQVVLIVVSLANAGVMEIRQGADSENPGRAFMYYNQVFSPHLAELIELYIIRDIPLNLAITEDLRILRNFYFAVEGYRFESADLQDMFDPLLWYKPYNRFPNDPDALPETSRAKVMEIRRIERQR